MNTVQHYLLSFKYNLEGAKQALFWLLWRPSVFGQGFHCPSCNKIGFLLLFWPILGHFLRSVGILVTLKKSNNKNPTETKKKNHTNQNKIIKI